MNNNAKPGRLKKDAAYVYSGYFLRYLSAIILVPYYGRVLGPASYGKVLAALSLTGIVWMTVNYGFSTIGVRELAMAEDESLRGEVFGRQLMARLILMPVGIAIGVIGTLCSPALSSDPWFGVIATIIGLVSAMNLGWFFQGLREFRTSVALEALVYPLNIVLILWLVRGPSDGFYALLAFMTTSIICSMAAYAVALRRLKTTKITFTGGVKEIKDSSVIFLQSVNSMLMTSGSTYLLSALSSPEQVGFFGTSERLVSFALAFLAPAGQLLMPTITHRRINAPGQVRGLIRKAMVFELVYGACAFLGGLFLAPYIVPLAFGPQFHDSIRLLKILVLVLPFAAFTHAFGLYVLIPRKKEKWLVLAISAGNTVNLILIALLAHGLGGRGVSIARVSGEFVTALVLVGVGVGLKKSSFSFRRNAMEIADAVLPER